MIVVAASFPFHDAFADEKVEPDATKPAESPAEKILRSGPPPPIGVRFGESLDAHEIRVGYSFEQIQRQGLMAAGKDITPSQVRALPPQRRHGVVSSYLRTPRSLAVSVHTVQLAYAPHERATLVAEIPFVRKELESIETSGARTQEQTEGIGDVVFALVVPFIRKGRESSHVHFAIEAPTGSIRRGGDDRRLPYDSQIGNGTVDLEWGWTYRGETNWLSWGGQAVGHHPVGKNGLKYREGSRFDVSLWGASRIGAGLSMSLRIAWQKQNNIRSFDRSFVPIEDPSDNDKARGGTRLTVTPGFTLELPQLANQRLAVEVGVPVHQDLDGPQLEQDWTIKAGWLWDF
jgi:hypothetical protein